MASRSGCELNCQYAAPFPFGVARVGAVFAALSPAAAVYSAEPDRPPQESV